MKGTDHVEPGGVVVPASALSNAKAAAFATFLEDEPGYTTLLECRSLSSDGVEMVVFETEVTVPQAGSVFGIEPRERMAVSFFSADDRMPEVLALRTNFPLTSHQNQRAEEIPRSLCVTDQRYEDLKRRWTGRLLLDLIRSWLKRAAHGELHADDQPLEPFFMPGRTHVLIPRRIFADSTEAPIHLWPIPGVRKNELSALAMVPAGEISDLDKEKALVRTLVFALQTSPVEHGVISKCPKTLEDVAEALKHQGYDLLSDLRRRLRAWRDTSPGAELEVSLFALVLWIPKKRRAEDKVPEANDTFALWSQSTVTEVGKDVGAWIDQGGHLVQHLPDLGNDSLDETRRGGGTQVDLFPVSFLLTRDLSSKMTATPRCDSSILVVGVGALGSHVASNLARCGFGKLGIIDEDVLLPHNLARHALDGSLVGHPKARAVASSLTSLLPEEPAVRWLSANVCAQDDTRSVVDEAIAEADLVLDITASVAAARRLAYAESDARRVSLYLNPTATDLVVLAEDAARELNLHDLEIQLYQALLSEDLSGHFEKPDRIRNGQGCRDVSVVLAPDQAALHAALGSRHLRGLGTKASITIFRTAPDGTVHRVDVSPSPVFRFEVADWTVVIPRSVLVELLQLRSLKLPNETGGILVGSMDLERRVLHVASPVASPKDSLEWPTIYVRGSDDLLRIVKRSERKTDGMLGYVGEWHSHPDGHSASPSDLDSQALENLAGAMRTDGLPGLSMIVGEAEFSVLLHDGSPGQVTNDY